jgi:hypothetical protein
VKGFNVDIQPSHVIDYLKQIDQLKEVASDITCTRLMTKNIRKRRLTFVSYRINIPRQHYHLIENPDIWIGSDGSKLEFMEFDVNHVNKRKPSSSARKPQKQKHPVSKKKAKKSKNEKAPVKTQPTRPAQSSGHSTNALQAQAQQLLGDLLHQVLSQHHPPRTQYNIHTRNFEGNHRNRRW